MGIDALLIASSTGARLLTRHFGRRSAEESLLLEREVVEHGRLYSFPYSKAVLLISLI